MKILQQLTRCAGVLCVCYAPLMIAQQSRSDLSNEPYEVSFRAGEIDQFGHHLYGTNLMKLVPFQGRLYASTADECDQTLDPHIRVRTAKPEQVPEPQLLVLNRSKGRWNLETNFGRNSDGTPRFKRVTNFIPVKFETDGQGRELERPVDMLVATLATFGGTGNSAIFTGIENQGKFEWAQTQCNNCTGESGRALGFYRDPMGVDRVFAGVQLGGGRGAIISGVYEPKAPGRIRWGPAEERGQARVMAFAVLENRIFALRRTQLLERETQRGPGAAVPSWKVVYSYSGPTELPLPAADSGLRGLSVLTTKPHTMLAVMEGSPGDVLQFTLTEAGVDVKHDVPIAELFRGFSSQGNDFGGRRKATYFIAGFNDLPTVLDPNTQRLVSLIGLEQYNHIAGHMESAWFVARGPAGYHTLHEVVQLPLRKGIDEPLNGNPGLRAVRTIVVSPFEEDKGQVLFMGGFDPVWECDLAYLRGGGGENDWHLHDNAWVYRVGIRRALAK